MDQAAAVIWLGSASMVGAMSSAIASTAPESSRRNASAWPPSRADIDITNRIAEAGRLMGVMLHDHVIIGREGHVSLKTRGLI